MCLIAFGHRAASGLELVVAANRDEFFARPTAPAQFWSDAPGILAGRDLRAGGTWMGITRTGRFAAITNFRNPRDRRTDAPSRGALVGDFLSGSQSPEAYLGAIRATAARYNGFSLLAGISGELWFFSNSDGKLYRVAPGVHGLSNHVLDEPWPKVRRATAALGALLAKPFDAEDCFELLADETVADDRDLPDTGLGLERERKSSAIRIRDAEYGTRCSSVLVWRADGAIEFQERSFAPDGSTTGTVRFSFSLAETGVEPGAPSRYEESPLPRTPGRAR
jgi:uncharacterized protein with NRDE domain